MSFNFDPQRARLPARDYQKSLVSSLLRHRRLAQGGKCIMIEVATGGGKTRVANDLIWKCRAAGDNVLVITKDWILLSKLAEDLCARHQGAKDSISYVGSTSAAKKLFEGAACGDQKPIVYSTIQTWQRRKMRRDFQIIIIDEIHWGEGAPLYTKLLKAHSNAVVIGLTATPRTWSTFARVGRAYNFGELLRRGVLARPIIEDTFRTSENWVPIRSGSHGDLTQSSLNELAADHDRNQVIVDAYIRKKEIYDKTLVFACNIRHAETLATLFTRSGIAAACIHHKLAQSKKQSVISDFEQGRISVLINITMMSHGIDIPSIKTIFLARPTLSDILFSQMIGRGSRRMPGKDSFYLVDFVDGTERHGVPIVRPDGFLGSLALRPQARGRVLKRHNYRPASFIFMPRVEGYEFIEGLDIHPHQTFGVEFEMATRNPLEVIPKIIEGIKDLVPTNEQRAQYTQKNYQVWNVLPDASCGVEVVSRILQGPEGFIELCDVSSKLRGLARELNLRLTKKTGTHVHLGWDAKTDIAQKLLRMSAYFEPALYSLVSPSRYKNNYCRPTRLLVKKYSDLSETSWRSRFSDHSLNIVPFTGKGTMEVRLHNGTLNGIKLCAWISMWMRMLEKSRDLRSSAGNYIKRPRRVPLCPGRRGSIIELAHYVNASDVLVNRLVARRKDVSRHWRRNTKYKDLAILLRGKWNLEEEIFNEVG